MKTNSEIVAEIERKIKISEKETSENNKKDAFLKNRGQYWFHRHSITLYKDLLSWITQENNLDGLSDD